MSGVGDQLAPANLFCVPNKQVLEAMLETEWAKRVSSKSQLSVASFRLFSSYEFLISTFFEVRLKGKSWIGALWLESLAWKVGAFSGFSCQAFKIPFPFQKLTGASLQVPLKEMNETKVQQISAFIGL